MSSWNATILTLFPEMFPGSLGHSLAGRALEKGIWSLKTVNIRDFSEDKHQSVDDSPFGGGAGMVMRPDILGRALDQNYSGGSLIYFSPRGRLLDQEHVHALAKQANVTLLCGRFEGIDQRVLEEYPIEEISVGDYVLSGGELPALILMDAVIRLLPNVMGKVESHEQDSFEEGLLEHSHYTRPQIWRGRKVPEILLSGHHEHIRAWRKSQAEELTRQRRPDLWERYCLSQNKI